jgi:ribosomal protein S18 acetylase RimI-like enzyme
MATGATIVRDARPEDADGIARVHVATWQGAYAHIFPPEALRALDAGMERRGAYWRQTIEAAGPQAHTLVAVLDDDVVGFADVRPTRDVDADAERVGELTAIYVSPAAWGVGAGRRLMTDALERLRGSGFEEATLWVLEDNPRARRFYEIAGWRADGSAKEDEFLGTRVREVRYRIELSTGISSG